MGGLSEESRKASGLDALPGDVASRILAEFYERLEADIQQRVEDRLSASQIDELEAFFARDDAAGAFRWLREALPEYDALVEEETAKLNADLPRQVAEHEPPRQTNSHHT